MCHFTRLFCIFLALATLSPPSVQAEVRKWRVEHYLQPSAAAGVGKFCYVITDGAAGQLLDQPIAGFAWQWGTVYQITVSVEQARTADGTVVKSYKLISVDSQTAVPEGTRFQMFLFDRKFIQGETLLGVKSFKCANSAVENELKRRLDNLAASGAAIPGAAPANGAGKTPQLRAESGRVLLEFSHPKAPSEPLILHSVTGASDLGLE